MSCVWCTVAHYGAVCVCLISHVAQLWHTVVRSVLSHVMCGALWCTVVMYCHVSSYAMCAVWCMVYVVMLYVSHGRDNETTPYTTPHRTAPLRSYERKEPRRITTK